MDQIENGLKIKETYMDLVNNIKDFKDGLCLEKIIERKSYIVIGEMEDYNLIDSLIEIARKKIDNNLALTNVKAKRTSFKSLVYEKKFTDFLNKIKPSIQKIFKEDFIISDVWANFYSEPKKDYCEMHHHNGNTAFCGVLYCTDGPGPGTYFKDFDLNILEKKGRFILFDPILFHEVKPYPYKKERITIAFNFNEIKKWDH